MQAKNNTNYGMCLGVASMPTNTVCNGSHPLVDRMCRCDRGHVTGGVLSNLAGALDGPDARIPWGTEWLGRTSDMDGYFWNFEIPFYKSVRVTGQLPADSPSKAYHIYSIIRGQENVPITVGGFQLPPGARMVVHKLTAVTVPSTAFIPIVNKTSGSGVIFGHVIAIRGIPTFNYLEGCWHLISGTNSTGYINGGVGAGFPGTILSTGQFCVRVQRFECASPPRCLSGICGAARRV